MHVQGKWGMKYSNSWLCYVIANYKLSLDNFNTKIMGYTEFICLYYKVLQLDHSELYGSFKAVAEETKKSNMVLCHKLGFFSSWVSDTLIHLLFCLPKEFTITLLSNAVLKMLRKQTSSVLYGVCTVSVHQTTCYL